MEEDEWIPETVFKIINGKTITEFFAKLKTHKEIVGTHIALQPYEMRRITLREFLPKGYDNSYKLAGNEITFMTFNTNVTEDCSYEVKIEGPYKAPKTKEDELITADCNRITILHQND